MKEARRRRLLAIDAGINAILGLCLLAIPGETIGALGLPEVASTFYLTVLGGVLLGIGIALWIERQDGARWRGLGLGGALVINGFGAGVVLVWLLAFPPDMPLRGYVSLWVVVAAVLGTAVAEAVALLSGAE